MKFVRNSGTDRVIDQIRSRIIKGHQLDIVSPVFSLFAFAELMRELDELSRCRIVLPPADSELNILGSAADRAARNRLQSRRLAIHLIRWVQEKSEVRRALGPVPQSAFADDVAKTNLAAILNQSGISNVRSL